MARHLDETPGRTVPVWQQANRFYVEDVPSPLRTQSEQKPTKKSNNSYKPSKSTKRGDTVGAGEYAVSKGDSLWKIAQAHGTTVEALKKANPEIKGNMIYPGQIINIGNKTNTSTSTSNNNTTTTTTRQSVTDNIKENSQRFTSDNNNVTNNQTAGYIGSIFTNTQRNQNDVIVNRDNNGRLILTSPFTQPEQIDYNEPIRLRKTLKPAVVKGKRSIKTTKGNNNNIQQELRKRNAFYKIVDNM